MRDGNAAGMDSSWMFVVAMLAVWRVTHLLAAEDGPWDVVVRVRMRLGAGMVGKLMDCFYCLSLWIALPVATWITRGQALGTVALEWLALSGAACLLERWTQRDASAREKGETFSNLETVAQFGTLPSSAPNFGNATNFRDAATGSLEGGTSCAVVRSEVR